MADRDELLNQFSAVTGVDQDRATFHLEAAAWNLEVAMANFYEEHEDEGSASHPVDVDEMEEEDEPELEPQFIQKKKKTPKPKSNSRFGTIGGLRTEEDSSSEEEGQAFYAGGSERSGQQVLGPKKKDNDSLVTDLFQSAKDHGAEELESSSGATASASRSSAFHGTGYRLGETEGPLESVAGPSIPAHRRQVDMTLKLWKKGFSIDSGELRSYDDPTNKDVLDCIRRGEIPQELIRQARGGEVNLNMEDHRTEDYVKPKASRTKAFSGEGHMLGSPAPAVVTTASSGASSADPAPPAPQVDVDASKPVTTLQIRLADGHRMVAKFNLSHTVGDVRNHIVASFRQYAGANFVLMTTFPNKELTEEGQTLEDAKLANAVIVQRLK